MYNYVDTESEAQLGQNTTLYKSRLSAHAFYVFDECRFHTCRCLHTIQCWTFNFMVISSSASQPRDTLLFNKIGLSSKLNKIVKGNSSLPGISQV